VLLWVKATNVKQRAATRGDKRDIVTSDQSTHQMDKSEKKVASNSGAYSIADINGAGCSVRPTMIRFVMFLVVRED
jgi:hypothetical protein